MTLYRVDLVEMKLDKRAISVNRGW